jgi:hypothetical protein
MPRLAHSTLASVILSDPIVFLYSFQSLTKLFRGVLDCIAHCVAFFFRGWLLGDILTVDQDTKVRRVLKDYL